MCNSSKPTDQTVHTTTSNVPDWLQDPIQANAARSEVIANRPYQSYGGQRVADFDQGYNGASGIVNGLQQGGPQSYNSQDYNGTQFQQGAGYEPTQFQQGSGYNATGYNNVGYNKSGYNQADFNGGPQYQEQSYNGPSYNGTQFQQGSDYVGANLEQRPDYASGPYQGGQYGAGNQYSGLGSYANTPGAANYSPREASMREFSQAEVDKYMSPYLSNVVDSQVSRANTQFDRDMAVTRLQGARGGGYGDYGSRVSEAILRSDHNRNVNDMVASSLQSGFRDATGNMQSWRDADLSRQGLSQADRQFGGQLNQSDRQFGRTSDLNDAQFGADFGLRQNQELNSRNMSERQFGANLDSQNQQFGARLGLDQAQQLNQMRENQSQFGANMSQQDRQQMNELRMKDNQFGSDFASQQAQFGAQFGAGESQYANSAARDIAGRQNDFNLNQNQFAANFDSEQNQFGANFAADQNKFGANLASSENQFGANLAQQDRQQLNELNAKERQYGYSMSQEERQQLNDLRMRDNQFGADSNQRDRQFGAQFGMDARNQFYNQQMGVAGAMRDDADSRMRYQQAGLDTQYQDFMDNRDWDQKQASWLSSILYGAPGSVQNDYQNVYRNPLAQGIGSAAAITALANGGGG